MKIMKFRLIPNWRDENLTCEFCGTTKSVKFMATDENQTTHHACNKCVLERLGDE